MPRVTDAAAQHVPRVGTRSVGKASGSVSHRNEAQGARRFCLTPRLAYEYVRIPVVLTSLKPEAARSLFPRLIDRNHHFCRLLSQPGLTPPRISTSRVSRATETFLAGGHATNASSCGRRECAVCACFDRIRTRRSSATCSAENLPLAAGQRTGRQSAHGLNFQPVDAEPAAIGLRLQAPPTPWRRGWRLHPSSPAKGSRRAPDAAPSIETGPRPFARAACRTR